MKKSFFIATVVALFLGVLSFISCTPDHDSLNDGQPSYLNYEFSVAEQVNVQQYEIEVSTTGNVNGEWTTAGVLMANTGGLTHTYNLQVDVTRWFKEVKVLYSRIKSVDLDGKVMYSKIQTTTYQ